ncbi:hypothetical protein NKR19_g4729 [Coniochaeta hoffmannii]|uniref:Uncharacterized protein n=1 Tax=Coniochaeta hoffmannii TaxID=91930 RepID=A0AA38S6Q1_9PEZI|nr:hypothetical protein NKR19_g4729 [Coniochaeta hoffmannii]
MADSDASAPPNSLHPTRSSKQTKAASTPRSSLTAFHTDIDPPKPRVPLSKHVQDDDNKRHSKAVHRSHKHRSSGAFLLPDALRPESSAPQRTHTHRRHATTAENHITTSGSATPEKVVSNVHANGGQAITPESTSKRSTRTSDTISGAAAAQRDSLADATTLDGSERPGAAPLDMDSAQIVNMALNLSESRRLAARRNISSPLPPKLAPLPDSAAGGSLRQHLQQQRRVSRNISPRPGAVVRSGSGHNVSSPLKPGFEPEGSYRYHFSQSTLSRAQKAKDYLELQALYRKVLDLVPPLTPERDRRLSSNVSPYGSPAGSQSVSRATTRSFEPDMHGRPYNPLQYVRNRKVRTRERKTIDGEAQGFADVARVSEWVDEATRCVASGQIGDSGSTLPPFDTPEEITNGVSTSQPGGTMTKTKRPRVDWVIDPADMLADVYWLEQDTNKNMVEDRDGRRVFVQDSSLFRPLSRQIGDRANNPALSSALQDATGLRVETDPTGLEQKTSKGESDHMFGSARERAQQKLQAIKGLHHRHNSSRDHRHYDSRHSRSGSLSESSDNDSDRKGRARGETIGSSGKEILEKQMLEMFAREHREKELEARYGPESGRQRSLTAESVAPKGDSVIHSTAPSRTPSHSRKQSAADPNGDAKAKVLPVSPKQSTRASLEVPITGRRLSIDYDTSYPASPEFKPNRGTGIVPALGKDLSPRPSRPSSPSRNPLSKVKSIFRDRSRERYSYPDSRRGSADANAVAPESAPDTPLDRAKKRPDEKRGSVSPIRKVISRGSDTSHRSPRSGGSLRHRGDDSYGLRGLLKAPRIDSVLRSGVSRVSDLIWRKDPDGAGGDSSTSSDESDTEPGRGRPRESAAQPDTQGPKTYLNVMPSFVPTSQSHSRLPQSDQGLLYPANPASRPISRQSSRFELLKPPKIEIKDTSPNGAPPEQKVPSRGSSDTSGADSSKSSHVDPNTSLNAAISMPQLRRLSTGTTSRAQRHWSISDGNNRPAAPHAVVSRAEIARLRALVLSSGIMAKEIDRRARERRPPDRLRLPDPSTSRHPSSTPSVSSLSPSPTGGAPPLHPTWSSIAALHPDPRARAALLSDPLSQTDLFPAAARTLASAIEQAGTRWQSASQTFSASTAPRLHREIEAARQTVAGRLSDMTRSAADEADEVSLDLSQGQRLKVKRVVDVIEKMLRRRRRRFRWVRRGLWLGVEWVLVGFMWYVWFVVVIARMVLGVGKGVVSAVRWLLWL